MHFVIKKLLFVEFMAQNIAQSNSARPFIVEIQAEVLPKVGSIDVAWAQFASATAGAVFPDEDDDGAEAAAGAGNFHTKTKDKFEEFSNQLKEVPAKHFAAILYALWSGECDEEIAILAAQDLHGPAKPWLTYLQPLEQDAVGEQTQLQALWGFTLTVSMRSQPVKLLAWPFPPWRQWATTRQMTTPKNVLSSRLR